MNKKIILYILFLILFFVTFFLINLNTTTIKRYPDDYIAVDYVKAKNIINGVRPPTTEELEKYDVNCDGKLTNNDTLIMRCLICEVFDVYEIKNKYRKAIKYKEE